MVSAYWKMRGTKLPVSREKPSVSALFTAWRSMAWLAASRTRRSAHGDLGSHWSGSSSQKAPESSGATTLKPGAFCSASAVGPVRR